MDSNNPPRLTRRQLAAFLTERGFPIEVQTLDNYRWRRVGPPVVGYWGRTPLFDPSAALAWAESRLRRADAPEAA